MQQGRRAHFTPRMIPFLGLDALGMLLCGAGLMFLVKGVALFGTFPATLVEALLVLVAGLAAMIYAVAGILREMVAQRAREQAASDEAA